MRLGFHVTDRARRHRPVMAAQSYSFSTAPALAQDADDRELVRRVIGGDAGAFDVLCERTRGLLHACFRRAAGRSEVAARDQEDFIQSFLLLIIADDYRVLRSYRGEAAFTTWLHTVAARHFRRELVRREREYRRERALEGEATVEAVDRGGSPEEIHAENEKITRVRSAMNELPDADRLLLEMLVLEDAPVRSVAAALSITPDGVRMRKMRILRKLIKLVGSVL